MTMRIHRTHPTDIEKIKMYVIKTQNIDRLDTRRRSGHYDFEEDERIEKLPADEGEQFRMKTNNTKPLIESKYEQDARTEPNAKKNRNDFEDEMWMENRSIHHQNGRPERKMKIRDSHGKYTHILLSICIPMQASALVDVVCSA